MNDIKISLIGSAFRTNNWLKVYNSVRKNNINFEIIFVGPKKPDFQLPDNFKFIQSNVKPVQCIEIAARAASGELIQIIPDDILFIKENSLDLIYKTYYERYNYKNLFSMLLCENGKAFDADNFRLNPNKINSPFVGVCNVISKSFFYELGGLDKAFIASMYDIDFSLRAILRGGQVLMTDIKIDERKLEMSEGSHTAAEYWNIDRKHLLKLWSKKGNTLIRNEKFMGFNEINLLKYSQGPRGRWRGNKPIIIEKFIDGPYKFFIVQLRRIISFSKFLYYIRQILNKIS